MKTVICPTCEGSGRLPDQRDIGRAMRARRVKADLSLREVARRMALSAAYVSDLELGKRGWRAKVTMAYGEALRKAKQ